MSAKFIKTVVIVIATVFFYHSSNTQGINNTFIKKGLSCDKKYTVIAIKAGSCLNCLSNIKIILEKEQNVVMVLSGVRKKEMIPYLQEKLGLEKVDFSKIEIINDDTIFQLLSPNGYHTLSEIHNCKVILNINLADDQEVNDFLDRNKASVQNATDSLLLEENENFVLNSFCKIRVLNTKNIVAFNQVLNKLAVLNLRDGYIKKVISLSQEENDIINFAFFENIIKKQEKNNQLQYNKYIKFIKQGKLKIYPINFDVLDGKIHVFYQVEYPEYVDSISAYKRFGICIRRLDSLYNVEASYYMLRNTAKRPDCFTDGSLNFDFTCVSDTMYKMQVYCDPVNLDNFKNQVYAYYKVSPFSKELELVNFSKLNIPEAFVKTNLYYSLLSGGTQIYDGKEMTLFTSLPLIYGSDGKVKYVLDKQFEKLPSDSLEDFIRSHYFYMLPSTDNDNLYIVALNWRHDFRVILDIRRSSKSILRQEVSDMNKNDMMHFEKDGYIYFTRQTGEDFYLLRKKLNFVK